MNFLDNINISDFSNTIFQYIGHIICPHTYNKISIEIQDKNLDILGRCHEHGLSDYRIILYKNSIQNKTYKTTSGQSIEFIQNYYKALIIITLIHELFHEEQKPLLGYVEPILFNYYIEEPVYFMTYQFIKINKDFFIYWTGINPITELDLTLPDDINFNYINRFNE